MKWYFYILFFSITLYGQNYKYEFDHTLNYSKVDSKGNTNKFSVSINSNNTNYHLYTFVDSEKQYRAILYDNLNKKIHKMNLDHSKNTKFQYIETINIDSKSTTTTDEIFPFLFKSNLTYRDSISEEYTTRFYSKKDSAMINSSKIYIKKDTKLKAINQLTYLSRYIGAPLEIDKNRLQEFYKIVIIQTKFKNFNSYLELNNDYVDNFSIILDGLSYNKNVKIYVIENSIKKDVKELKNSFMIEEKIRSKIHTNNHEH